MADKRAIGIFDSGVGGLTVCKELIRELPNEDIIYLGDTARVPYGTKSRQTIKRFSTENALFLLKHNVKLIVVACNSSSSVALDSLKKNFKVPVIGVIAPGVSDALKATKSNRIGVIGTLATIDSQAYQRRILNGNRNAKVFTQSCPLFVPLAEEGWVDKKITVDIISEYLKPLHKKSIDTLILGCTHYPLLKKEIKRFMGKTVDLIDSGTSTARAVKSLILDSNLDAPKRSIGKRRFFVTDEISQFKRTGERFLKKSLASVKKVENGI